MPPPAGSVSLYARSEGALGVYPNTPMGVMAVLRNPFTEAGCRRAALGRDGSAPRGTTHPAYPPVLEAFSPSLDGAPALLRGRGPDGGVPRAAPERRGRCHPPARLTMHGVSLAGVLLALLLALAAPEARAQKPEDKPAIRAVATASLFVGTWDYVVRPADPMAQGAFVIEERGGRLAGLFQTDAPRPIDPFAPSGDAISFSFKQPGMGTVVISGTLSGDAFEGEVRVEGQDDVLPFAATRQAAAPAAAQ